MFEARVTGDTLPEAYHYALESLKMYGEYSYCEDWDCEQLECSMTMVVKEPLSEPMISRFFIGGFHELKQYTMEMSEGILDFEIERGNWEYTYHDRMTNYHGKNQMRFIVDELKRNPSSRRAVIIVRDVEKDMGSNDPACLQIIQYFIRKQKLDCVVVFRSNDAVKATFMNAFALIMIQKSIADALGVKVGTYTHRANSFHCYERDFPMLMSFVDRMQEDTDLAFEYDGFWKELMDAEEPAIRDMVRELRSSR